MGILWHVNSGFFLPVKEKELTLNRSAHAHSPLTFYSVILNVLVVTFGSEIQGAAKSCLVSSIYSSNIYSNQSEKEKFM